MTIYNSRGNQIDIAQIIIYKCFLQIKSNQIKCWFLVRGENRSTRGKTSPSRVENQQTPSTFDAECGNRTRATLVEGKCSHHNANPATFIHHHALARNHITWVVWWPWTAISALFRFINMASLSMLLSFFFTPKTFTSSSSLKELEYLTQITRKKNSACYC